MNLLSPTLNPVRYRGFSVGGWLGLLVCGCMVLGMVNRASAGCHYGDGRSFTTLKQSDNPREHARNFRFLGQWVYERGEIKYVPLQSNQPCHGPECRSEKPRPVSTAAPARLVHRLTTIVLIVIKSQSIPLDAQCDWVSEEDGEPLAGFAREHEHPPRVELSV